MAMHMKNKWSRSTFAEYFPMKIYKINLNRIMIKGICSILIYLYKNTQDLIPIQKFVRGHLIPKYSMSFGEILQN